MNFCFLCLIKLSNSKMSFCYDCQSHLPFIKDYCKSCALPTSTMLDMCGHCQSAPFSFDQAASIFEYEYPITHWLSRYKENKHNNTTQLEQWLFSAFYHKYNQFNIDAIFAIPSSPIKTIKRGETPSHPLARAIQSRSKIPFYPNVFSKSIFKSTQKSKNRSNRISSAHFQFHPQRILKPIESLQSVLIVDDVMTTGASLNEASKILKAQGVKQVLTLTVARTPRYK